MPPLRVDPALLGGTALAQRPVSGASVGENAQAVRPELAFLLTDYPPGGKIAHPSTTPMSHVSKADAPTIISARRITGVNDVETVAEGDAVMMRAGDTLSGERITYRVADDEVEAIGNVKLASPDTSISGPRMRLRMEEGTGEFESPAYVIRREQKEVPEPALTLTGLPAASAGGKAFATTGKMISQPPVIGRGEATRLEFRGEDQYRLQNASYSTCAPGRRDWELVVDELDLDYNEEVGKGRGAVVRFMDVPIFYSPWMSFSLNNDKKSGFLPPTIGTSSKSGLEVTAPYFWNIAPDMDATISPRAMSRRGLQVNTEFRYLLDTAQNRTLAISPQVSSNAMPDKGQIRLEYLPDDKLAGRDRYGYAISHNQTFLLPAGHTVTANLNLNGVSDDDYYSDLSTRIAAVSQGNLLRQGRLTAAGPWYSASVNMESYQTLLTNSGVPYRRLPQITATANRYDLPLGIAVNFDAEHVSFDHPDFLVGTRSTLYPRLSLPFATPYFWLTPKLGIHSTQYDLGRLDRPSISDNPDLIRTGFAPLFRNVADRQSRSIPILSVDGGFVMERDANLFGQSLTQTLEPRAFYTYIPRRDQSTIPIFDTGTQDFSYAQMFSENRYAGGDRIGDANQLTLAATSRILNPTNGAEVFRAMIGSRYYFTQQYENASLPGERMRSGRSADLLAAFAGQVLPNIYADVAWQYNPRDDQTERLNFGARYRPEANKIINAGYRFARSWYNVATRKFEKLGQIDVSTQWPLFGGWSGVGRYNYSTEEHRVIETIGGLEYNAGCWTTRAVVQRLATIADKPTTALFFQLELNDFSKIGSNPMNLLRRNIPGYGIINQPTADPVFAEN